MWILSLPLVVAFLIYYYYARLILVWRIWRVCCRLIWLSILQRLGNSMFEYSPNEGILTITYIWWFNVYKVRVNVRKRRNILSVLDENDNIITDRVIPYLGPGMDWHERPEITASMFGATKLTMLDECGEEVIIV